MADVTGAADTFDWVREGLESSDMAEEELNTLIAEGVELMANVLAPNTIESYDSKFGAFERWCESIGACALPARPQTIAAYLLRLAKLGTTSSAATYTDAAIDDAGRLRASTLAAVVSAIGSVHRNNGHVNDRDPTQHPRLRRLLGAYARSYRHLTVQAHAYTLEELGLMCDRATMPTHEATRDLLLLTLAAHPLVDLNANRLSRLRWTMVTLPAAEDGLMPARIDLGGRIGSVWVPPEPDDERLCPVTWLRAWSVESGVGPVFDSPSKPGICISRQGIADRMRHLMLKTGTQHATIIGELPRLAPSERLRAVEVLRSPSAMQVRDRALLTTMWWMGQRAEAIERLHLGDLRYDAHTETLRVFVRRSKTDQFGTGLAVTLTAQPGYVGCPVAALQAWIPRYALLLGIPGSDADGTANRFADLLEELARRGAPLFPQLNREEPGSALRYDGINDVVKKYSTLIGLVADETERMSSQGLRAGNATVLLQNGRSAEAVAAHQGRKDTRHLLTYYRPNDDIELHPSRGLASGDRTRRADATGRRSSEPEDRSLVEKG